MRAPVLAAAMALLSACNGASGGAAGSAGGPATTSASSGSSSGMGGETPGSTSSSSGAGGAGAGGAATGGAGGGGSGGIAWGPEHCPPAPAGVEVGFSIGDQLGEVVVKDCDGNDVSLTRFCGASALFVFAAYGWCPLCQSVSAQQEALTDSFAGQNVASLNIIIQNGQAQPPDAAYCKVWRAQHGHEDVVTLYDPTGAVLALWNGGGSSSYSAFIDSDRVIVSTLAHNGDISAIEAGIEGALAH